MLAMVLDVPQTEEDWSRWSYANYDCLNQIRGAIQNQYTITLPEYQVEPIDFADVDTFLSNNQQAHIDFTSALGQQSNDLIHTDLRDPNQRQAWVWLNFKELQDACAKLKIGP